MIAAANVPPSELGMWPLPEGWDEVWIADDRCRPATRDEHDARTCRRPRCGGAPVMALERTNGWWLYCAEHLYGRRIHNGIVECRRARRQQDASE